ncbi:MAG: imelysin family protein [Bacteroidota bacterium]|nr:imelysin family protein [Bacteroidota bacterium]
MKKSILKTSLLTLLFISYVSCNKDDNPKSSDEGYNPAYTATISNISNEVIISTYNELNQKALTLISAIENLSTQTNMANLQLARQAWIDTRKPWEQSEGFLYGPVDSEGIDPAIDTWPVDVEAMNNILNSNQTITPELIASNAEARGFHLIEFLLWGENSDKTPEQLTSRQKEYLIAAAQDLQNNTQALYSGWIPSGGNFVNNFLYPSINSDSYKSQKAVLLEITEGLITIADEVVTGKIQEVLDNGVVNEESRFSNNSKADFADNIRSIQNVYLGDYTSHQGEGLSDLVASKNINLDNQINQAIITAIEAIESIPGTFTLAVTQNTTSVEYARDKVLELKEILESQLKPFVSNSL